MSKPNIFRYATKELSQDAFICWLLEHINLTDEKLPRTVARLLMTQIVDKYKELYDDLQFTLEPWENYEVLIKQQQKKIDILINFVSKISRQEFYVLIEDKTWSEESRPQQVESYYDDLMQDKPNSLIIPVFLKTGYVYTGKLQDLQKRKIVSISGEDIYNLIKPNIHSLHDDEILSSWWDFFEDDFYNPIEQIKALSIDPDRPLKDLQKELISGNIRDEILFDRITSLIFDATSSDFNALRNVEGKPGRALYEYILFKDEWQNINNNINRIGFYFSWSSLTLDVKTISDLTKKKMPSINLAAYEKDQDMIKEQVVLPPRWEKKNSFKQIFKLEQMEELSINQLQILLKNNIQTIGAQIDKVVSRLKKEN